MNQDLHYLSAIGIAAEIRAGRCSARDALEHHIRRIERIDGGINAVVVRDFERAGEQADALDRLAAKGELSGPLHGVPVTVKESFNIGGLATHWGAPWLADQIADRDATVVEKLRAAGAVVMGKTNVPFMLQDYQTRNDIHGVTNNPWDLARSPGGSSGGSAAALCAGMSALEFGSDIGGSIRRPANHCGVYGLKPTWNIISGRGHSPTATHFAWAPADLAVVGPMARTIDDLELALDLTAGPDEWVEAGLSLALPACEKSSLQDFKLAYMPTHPDWPVDQSVVDCLDRAVTVIERAGGSVNPVARPSFDFAEADRIFRHLVFSVFTASMPMEEIEAARKAVDAAEAPPEGMTALIAAAGLGLHRDWLSMNDTRAGIREAWAAFFQDFDLLLTPCSSTAAFEHISTPLDQPRFLTVNGEQQAFFQQSFWTGLAVLAYLPALSIPCGQTPAGLPVGMQAIGPACHDKRLIQFARLLARQIDGFTAPPNYT